MKIIGLGHRKFMGKDTAYQYLREGIQNELLAQGREANSFNIKRLAFADALKDFCQQLYPEWIRDKTYYEHNTEAKSNWIQQLDMRVRDVWIKVGNALRTVDDLVWIRAGFQSMKGATHVIVTDVRYPNEAQYINDLGGLLFKIHNPRVALTDDVADCALEEYPNWDEIIQNDGSKKELEEKCKNLIARHSRVLTAK